MMAVVVAGIEGEMDEETGVSKDSTGCDFGCSVGSVEVADEKWIGEVGKAVGTWVEERELL